MHTGQSTVRPPRSQPRLRPAAVLCCPPPRARRAGERRGCDASSTPFPAPARPFPPARPPERARLAAGARRSESIRRAGMGRTKRQASADGGARSDGAGGRRACGAERRGGGVRRRRQWLARRARLSTVQGACGLDCWRRRRAPRSGRPGAAPGQHVALVGFETTVAPRQAPFPFLAVRRADCLLPCSLPFAAVTAAQTRST